MMARDVKVGDVILTWLGWLTVERIERWPEYDRVRFSVSEIGSQFNMTLGNTVSVRSGLAS